MPLHQQQPCIVVRSHSNNSFRYYVDKRVRNRDCMFKNRFAARKKMCVGVLQQKEKDFDKNWYKLNIKMTAKDVFVEKNNV